MPNRQNTAPRRDGSTRQTYIDQMLEGPDGRTVPVQVNVGESPLSWLHARGKLSRRLYEAGEHVRRDWEAAGLGPRVTMVWDGQPSQRQRRGAGMPPGAADRHIAARARFDGAMIAAGPGLRDIVWRVACAGEGLSAAEKAMDWPSRAGKLVLTLALERLADFYRIP